VTKLSDHWSDGSTYLDEGWHVVTITDVKMFDYTSGSRGIEYRVEDDAGAGGKASFCINKPGQTDDKRSGMLKVLASFVRSCGITQEQAKAFEVESERSHRHMIGKQLKVLSEKVGKYHEIMEWTTVDAKTTNPARFDRTQHDAALAAQAPADDDIPF